MYTLESADDILKKEVRELTGLDAQIEFRKLLSSIVSKANYLD